MAWNPFRKQSHLDFAALDRWRVARKLAVDDVTDLGSRLAELKVDDLGHEASHRARHALELHTQARGAVRTSATVEDVLGVEKLLVDARYHWAAVLALEAGEPSLERRDPCFFDPRHGPSAQDIQWSPPVGASRTVPACPDDAQRLRAGEEPLTRRIRVGDRYVLAHEVDGYQGVLEHQDRLFREQSSSHDGYKYLAQEEIVRPGTRFGGGDGVEGGARGNSNL